VTAGTASRSATTPATSCVATETRRSALPTQRLCSTVPPASPSIPSTTNPIAGPAAVRNRLGVALLAGGADGLRTIDEGPLAEPFIARLWLVSNEPVPELAEALRSGLARSRA
jgi:hypothetical protein